MAPKESLSAPEYVFERTHKTSKCRQMLYPQLAPSKIKIRIAIFNPIMCHPVNKLHRHRKNLFLFELDFVFQRNLRFMDEDMSELIFCAKSWIGLLVVMSKKILSHRNIFFLNDTRNFVLPLRNAMGRKNTLFRSSYSINSHRSTSWDFCL